MVAGGVRSESRGEPGEVYISDNKPKASVAGTRRYCPAFTHNGLCSGRGHPSPRARAHDPHPCAYPRNENRQARR